MKVDVYWNLHKQLYSIRHKGKVVGHLPSVLLKDVRWVVQPAGRRRVLRERRKNVHAFARGTWIDSHGYNDHIMHVRPALTKRQPVMYNPYKHTSFVARDAPDIKVEWSDYAELGCQYHVTTDSYTPLAYISNFRTPLPSDPAFDRYDQGPKL